MKATTDNAVGCVCTPLKQHNQQSFFAAGYSLGWSISRWLSTQSSGRCCSTFLHFWGFHRYTKCKHFGTLKCREHDFQAVFKPATVKVFRVSNFTSFLFNFCIFWCSMFGVPIRSVWRILVPKKGVVFPIQSFYSLLTHQVLLKPLLIALFRRHI